jgi:predicted enzyme related to lactoylglutathione lyase
MARSPDYLSAVGIGVADLDRSLDFYCSVLGMQKTQTFKLPHMEEIIVAHEGRNAVVLMHYTDGSTPNYKDNPVKLVFYVADAKARTEAIRAAGLEVTREAEALPAMGNAIIGMGKDPDGYVIELIQLATAPA